MNEERFDLVTNQIKMFVPTKKEKPNLHVLKYKENIKEKNRENVNNKKMLKNNNIMKSF